MQKIHIRRKIVNLGGREAAPTGKVNTALFPQQIEAVEPSSTIQTVTTTQLENFARHYERAVGNEFECSAILRGISAELAARDAEAKTFK